MKSRLAIFPLSLFLLSCAPGGSSFASSSLPSSEQESRAPLTEVAFRDYSSQVDGRFNNELFYRNDLLQDMGDPMVVYEDGYFYASGTHGTTSFRCFRSKDLTNWERLGDMFVPEPGSWSTKDLWAPDIQKIGDKWYLYYTASYSNNGTTNCQLGVAVSDHVYGPYKQVPGEDGTIATPPFSLYEEGKAKYCTILDSHVFQDDDGELYMYFSYDMKKCRAQDYGGYPVQEIWGAKMDSPTSWDKSTLTRLLSPGLAKLSDNERTVDWETWSTSFDQTMECLEGPYMIKHNGTYFLTYSGNSYVDTVYNVGYATSSSPLGEYVKPNSHPLQNMLLGVPGNDGEYINTRYLGFQTGTGHASICKVGDEYMFAFHAHQNRKKWGEDNNSNRALGLDYLYFTEDNVPYTRGPTWSINRLPNAVTGYSNLAYGKTVEGDGESLAYLTDNFSNRGHNKGQTDTEVVKEANFPAGESRFKIDLGEEKTVKFLLIGNSYDYQRKIDYIDEIRFDGDVGVKNVVFNQNYVNRDTSWIFPHSCFVVELEEEVRTRYVEITVSNASEFSLSEVEVYGK